MRNGIFLYVYQENRSCNDSRGIMSLIVRDVRATDIPLIKDSFVSGVKAIEMTNGLDPQILRTLIDKALMFRWHCKILCESTESDEIMAWMINEGTRVLWIARKPRYKGMKLGMKLMDLRVATGTIHVAFIAPHSVNLFSEHGFELKLRPYITTEIMSYE
jgi:hypothetical protein